MRVRNFAHKGLRRLYEHDDPRGVPADCAGKLRMMFAYLDEIESEAELRMLPSWKPHTLSGDRKGTWSLHVSRNWRLTFRVDPAEGEITAVNLEDYH